MKIVAKYKGAIIRDPKIGRALEVNEKNLLTLVDAGHNYLIEFEAPKKKIKKKLKNDIEITKKRNNDNGADTEGTSDVG